MSWGALEIVLEHEVASAVDEATKNTTDLMKRLLVCNGYLQEHQKLEFKKNLMTWNGSFMHKQVTH